MEGTLYFDEDALQEYHIKDSAKFQVIINVYQDIFENIESFSKRTKIGRSSLYLWLKNEEINFNIKSKTKICQFFELTDKVWSDLFYNKDEFEEVVSDYKKVKKIDLKKDISKHIFVNLESIDAKDNRMRVEELNSQEIEEILEKRMEQESASFMFALAKRLKSENKIQEALMVISWIEEQESIFRYKYENQIRHLKAVLLSDEDIQDWDGAIHILRSLYYSQHYHLQEPEILTLLASNYKRKALQNASSIDKTLLTSALCLYEESYELKPDENKYYDAINLAYLYNITDAIEVEYANKEEINELYRKLSLVWRIDRTNWWEVSTDAEFLMLLGKVEVAKSMIDAFMENHQADPKGYELDEFSIKTLSRQLRLYIDLTNDSNAMVFLEHVMANWRHIKAG